MNTYPTKSEYERALETVSKYEKRQETLERLEKDLSFHLKKFDKVKFKINKKEGKVLFSGLLNDQIKIAESKCSNIDVFNDIIGKLIAIKKALELDINDVVEHVESKNDIIAYSSGIIWNGLTAHQLNTHTSGYIDNK